MINDIYITVIIPAFNVGNFVSKTLDSLKNQTFQNFEIIVVNDGSTDSTLDVINSYKDIFSNYRVIDQENKGVSKSRNIGIELSIGKYICFIDGDDHVENNYLELMYNKIIENGSDMVYCGYTEVLTDGSVFRTYLDRYKYTEGVLSGKDVLLKYLKSETYMYIWSILFDKKLLENNKIRFYENISYGEDQIFNYESLAKANRVSCVNKELLIYLRHDQGTMQNLKNLKYLTILKSLYHLEKKFIDQKEDSKIINAVKYDKIVRTTVMILTNWAVLKEEKKYFSLRKRKIIKYFLRRAFYMNPFKNYKLMIKSIMLLYFDNIYFNIYKNKKSRLF
ncbi:MAG: glycosyltransferase [Candidatus Delongbacteria bacterium]|nr:glycosyltransferase [Candidatus Delongbacteria bacterium]